MKDTEAAISDKTDSGEQNQFIQDLLLPESVKELLIENNNAQGYQHLLAETFSEYISRSIAAVAVSILGMIVTFLVISLILHIIGGILNGIFSLPVLNLFNRVGRSCFRSRSGNLCGLDHFSGPVFVLGYFLGTKRSEHGKRKFRDQLLV